MKCHKGDTLSLRFFCDYLNTFRIYPRFYRYMTKSPTLLSLPPLQLRAACMGSATRRCEWWLLAAASDSLHAELSVELTESILAYSPFRGPVHVYPIPSLSPGYIITIALVSPLLSGTSF